MKVDEMAKAIAKELSEWSQELADGIKVDCIEEGKIISNKLKQTSPKRPNGGAYAKGWTSKVTHEDRDNIRVTVYNKGHYQLTHLLENGHAKVNGGFVPGIPHIGPAEQMAISDLEEKVKVRIG